MSISCSLPSITYDVNTVLPTRPTALWGCPFFLPFLKIFHIHYPDTQFYLHCTPEFLNTADGLAQFAAPYNQLKNITKYIDKICLIVKVITMRCLHTHRPAKYKYFYSWKQMCPLIFSQWILTAAFNAASFSLLCFSSFQQTSVNTLSLDCDQTSAA